MAYETSWRENWQRELEGEYLYKELSEHASSVEMRQALARMSEQEKQHAAIWADKIHASDPQVRPPKPDLRIRLTALLGRWFGADWALGLLLNDEVSDIATYSAQARESGYGDAYRQVLRDETAHARALVSMRHPHSEDNTEPWHRTARAGGWLREVVYGFNDGLTANFGLVMGVVGAQVNSSVIILTGFAGLLADALSMAASGYLAARSQQEVSQHHLELEDAELHLMPQEEREELIGFYTNKGLTRQEASTVADRLMQNPEVALNTLAREELGIDPETPEHPLQEGVTTGIATALGAVIPILPFIFLPGQAAVWAGIIISMLAHFLVGASRAVFTGRPAIRSGFEMFVVGMGVALLTYLLGLFFKFIR